MIAGVHVEVIEHDGASLKLYPLHAEVVKIDATTTTSISGQGGGSHTTLEGQFAIRPVSISSQTTYEREVWLKDMNGKEHTIVLNNKSIKLREGNLVTIGIVKGKHDQSLLSIKNHNTDNQYALSSNEALVNKYNFSKLANTMGFLPWLLLAGVAGVGWLFCLAYIIDGTGLNSILNKSNILMFTSFVILASVPLAILIHGFRRSDRAHREHNEAIEKVKEAGKVIMADPHPAIAT